MLTPLAAAAQIPPPASLPDSQISEADRTAWQDLTTRARDAFQRQDFATAENLAQQALAFAETHFGRDHQATINTAEILGIFYRDRRRFSAAMPLLRRVLEVRQRTLGPDADRTLDAMLNLAIAANGAQDFAEAEGLFRRLLPPVEARFGQDSPQVLNLLGNLATLNFNLGRQHEAVGFKEREFAGRQRTAGPVAPATLGAAAGLGLMYAAVGRETDAELLLEGALAAAAGGPGANSPDILSIYGNLGIVHDLVGDTEGAIDLERRALDGLTRIFGRDAAQTLPALNTLATIYQHAGRFAEAEPLRLRYVEANVGLHGPDHPDTITGVINLGDLYEAQGRRREAEELATRALQSLQRSGGADAQLGQAAMANLATFAEGSGNDAEAERLRRLALANSERLAGPDHFVTMNWANALGSFYRRRARFSEAEQYLRRALAGRERTRGPESRATLESVSELGRLSRDRNQPAEAESWFARALEGRTRVFGASHPDTIQSAIDLAQLRLRRPTSAAVALEPARRAAEGARTRLSSTEGGAFGQVERGREELSATLPFELLADAAWAAGAAMPGGRPLLTDEAFVALQGTMPGGADRAMIRMAVRHLADQQQQGLGALVREREELAGRWAANSGARGRLALSQAGGADELAFNRRLQEDQARIEARIAELDAQIGNSFPDYFALVRPRPLPVAQAQALLRPDEAILLVVPSEFGTQVVAVTREQVQWVRSGWARGQVDQAVGRLLQDIRRTLTSQGRVYAYDRQTAFALYRELIAPVAGTLAGRRTLFVAAAGSLSAIPFGILVTEAPRGADDDPAALRDTGWFADAHALVQLPSLQSLQLLRRPDRTNRAEPGADAGFVGFGDPLLSGPAGGGCTRGSAGIAPAAIMVPGRGPSGAMMADVAQLRQLCPLPGAARELEDMRAALAAPASAVFTRAASTEPQVRTMNLSRAHILAFATHGLVAGEMRGAAEPGLVLTPPATASSDDDGYLAASEISALRLDADWVILSACNTAAGDGSAGAPALSGLARAFFYAGARNVLVSHWQVVDDAGPRLTVRTIALQRATPGLGRAAALQMAMREVRRDAGHPFWSHPAVWAPFVLVGDGVR